MATQNAPTGQVVDDGLPASAPAEPAEPSQDSGWFLEFSKRAFDLSLTLNRTIALISIIAVGAIAVAYWGAYTEHYYVAGGAIAVLGLAMLAWTIAIVYMLWKLITGSAKWWVNRRGASSQRDNR